MLQLEGCCRPPWIKCKFHPSQGGKSRGRTWLCWEKDDPNGCSNLPALNKTFLRDKTHLRDKNSPLWTLTRKGKWFPRGKMVPNRGKSRGALLGSENGDFSNQWFKEMQLRRSLMEKHLRWNWYPDNAQGQAGKGLGAAWDSGRYPCPWQRWDWMGFKISSSQNHSGILWFIKASAIHRYWEPRNIPSWKGPLFPIPELQPRALWRLFPPFWMKHQIAEIPIVECQPLPSLSLCRAPHSLFSQKGKLSEWTAGNQGTGENLLE